MQWLDGAATAEAVATERAEQKHHDRHDDRDLQREHEEAAEHDREQKQDENQREHDALSSGVWEDDATVLPTPCLTKHRETSRARRRSGRRLPDQRERAARALDEAVEGFHVVVDHALGGVVQLSHGPAFARIDLAAAL